MKSYKSWIVGLAAIATLLVAVPTTNADKKGAAQPNSDAFGQTFAEWLRDATAWANFGVGQAAQKNNVLFLPIPAPASWELWGPTVPPKNIGIGEMNLTMQPGTKFVLPILVWIGETYQDHNGVIGAQWPDDQPWAKSWFMPPEGEALVMLDGVPLVDAANQAEFYFGPIPFRETIWYTQASSYGSTGALWAQGIGVIVPPLSVGTHTLTLYSWDSWQGLYDPADNAYHGIGWFNTWHITVQPPGKK